MSPVDASTRGRSNRVKGATAERDVARWLKPWFPDACRAVRNTHPDPGDIDCTSPGLFWSVKNTQVERITPWVDELGAKGGTRIGLLVVKRAGRALPGEWWCWLRLADLRALLSGTDLAEFVLPELEVGFAPVRMELRHLMPLLVASNYAPPPFTETKQAP